MPAFTSRLTRNAALAVVLAGAPALTPCAFAQAPITLAEAQRLALERSRSLAAIESGVSASRDLAVAARRLPAPVLSLSLENLPVESVPGQPGLHPGDVVGGVDRFSTTDDSMTMRRIAVMQELTMGDKRSLRSERFELEAKKQLAEGDAARATIRREAALAWMEAWHAEAMAQSIAEQRVRGLQEVQGAEAEYRAGRGNQADLLMARGNLAALDDRAAEIERKARIARVRLVRWAGPAGEARLGARPDITRVDLDHHDLEESLAAHPEIAVLSRQQEVAAAEARLARANKVPDWTVEVAYSKRGSAYGDMVSVGVRVPLPWDQANRQDRELSARLAEVRRAEALRDEALREHVAEVRAMLQEWQSNRSRMARYEREIVPLAAARAEAALAAFRGGKSSVTEVLAARRGELEARLQALQLESETARLWAQLTFLTAEEAR